MSEIDASVETTASSFRSACLTVGPLDHEESRPEYLVVNGLRLWAHGCMAEDRGAWKEAARLYATHLSQPFASLAVAQLAAWVRSIRDWRPMELEIFAPRCRHVCRDECLALGMVAAWQHGDGLALSLTAAHLGGPAGQLEVAEAAQGLAVLLNASGFVLRPMPVHILRELADRPSARSYH